MFAEIEQGNQTLFPFDFEGESYYVRFVRRGRLINCSGVFKFIADGERLTPAFEYQIKHLAATQKVITAALAEYRKRFI